MSAASFCSSGNVSICFARAYFMYGPPFSSSMSFACLMRLCCFAYVVSSFWMYLLSSFMLVYSTNPIFCVIDMVVNIVCFFDDL